METYQIILIALFVYLASIGSIVGNTIGWYTLGRPLIAAFVVGLILGDVQTAMIVGIPLQIMYMGNVTPGGAGAVEQRRMERSRVLRGARARSRAARAPGRARRSSGAMRRSWASAAPRRGAHPGRRRTRTAPARARPSR